MKKITFISLLAITLILAACSSAGPEPDVITDNFEITQASTGFMPKGQILAGSNPYYIDFNEEDFNAALNSQKLVILNFYANWCPSCKQEDNQIREAIKETNLLDSTVIFRINYKDWDTSEKEKELAQKYQIITQGTKVMFVNGEQTQKTPQHYTKQQYLELLVDQ